MPCRNDWDPPTKAQAENRRAAKLLIALNNIHGKTSTTQLLVDSTNPVLDTDYVKVLCERMKALGELGRDKLLYSDARDPRARDLATWWEEHQARDEARMRTSPTLNLLGVCSEAMREAGKPYPRTCLVCGLGPCQRGRQLSVGVDLASGPDWTAVGAAPLVNAPATQVAGEKAIDDAMEIAERLALRLVFRNNTRTDSGYESADIAANEVRKELRAALESLAAPRQAER